MWNAECGMRNAECGMRSERERHMFRTLIFYAVLFLHYLRQNLKVKLAYRGNFLIGAVSTIVYGVINITFLWTFFSRIPTLKGWTFEEVLLMYGVGEATFGLFAIFFFTFSSHLSWYYIIEGNLDRVLTRPINPFFQVMMENMNLNDIIIVLKGGVILIYVSGPLALKWTFVNIAGVALFIISGALVYAGMFTTVASLSFWVKNREGLISPLYTLNEYSRFPMTVYPLPVRIFMSWVLPFAFVAFYPSVFIVGKSPLFPASFATPFVSLLVFLVGYLTWRAGLRRYESSGS